MDKEISGARDHLALEKWVKEQQWRERQLEIADRDVRTKPPRWSSTISLVAVLVAALIAGYFGSKNLEEKWHQELLDDQRKSIQATAAENLSAFLTAVSLAQELTSNAYNFDSEPSE
jgi:hypothetical protein